MKAISIKEPYATMILKKGKTIETRTWITHYRGKLVLCASKKPESSISGKAFAVAELIECREMERLDEKKAMCSVYPKAKAWVLTNIKPITPFEVKGQLRLFDVDYNDI